ncbi:MAG TPA: tRNA pseudouridine(38-40) synthase TruA [Atribacteraceae bacterium]|nr:tRNA pseudouridine(38-40) synthase TruA [Atribacteraceae bacterium]
MRNIALVLEYDGAGYFGWQEQPCRKTLQGTLDSALSAILGETVRAVASGRTDRGVHALGQVVSFTTSSDIPVDTLGRALNGTLPPDMRVLNIRECPPHFHARNSAVRKEYRYLWYSGEVLPVLLRNRAFWCGFSPPDLHFLEELSRCFVGTHDFTSFSASGNDSNNPIRTIERFEISLIDDHLTVFTLVGDGFLYRMVRIILGELWMVLRGKRTKKELVQGINQPGRKHPRLVLPPEGLYLVRVEYDSFNPFAGLKPVQGYSPWLRWEKEARR